MLMLFSLTIFVFFILGVLLDISFNLRRLNDNVKKLIK